MCALCSEQIKPSCHAVEVKLKCSVPCLQTYSIQTPKESACKQVFTLHRNISGRVAFSQRSGFCLGMEEMRLGVGWVSVDWREVVVGGTLKEMALLCDVQDHSLRHVGTQWCAYFPPVEVSQGHGVFVLSQV